MEAGHPDFKIKDFEGETFYIEVKKNEEGVRQSQFKWLINNCKDDVWYLIIESLDGVHEFESKLLQDMRRRIDSDRELEIKRFRMQLDGII